ncbi:MAG: thioredoxin-disulfide reductase [Candidatus Woesebacteria bacterium]
MNEIHNVIIIGSGPSGWTAATYLARANLAPLLFAGEKAGGQLMLTTVIENYPGFPQGVDGPLLMQNMRDQAKNFGTQIIDKNITKVDFSARPFKVWSGEEEFQAKAILISTGAENVWLGIPGEMKLVGRGVSSCAVCDAAFFKEKNTYVIGGGDAAMEDTLALTKFAKSVTLVHRRDSFKASKIMQDRVLANPKVSVIWNAVPKEIKGEAKVETLVIEDVNTHEIKELPADGVFVAIGHKPSTEIFSAQIQLDEKKFITVRQGLTNYPTMTSVEGVFAAGDCVDYRYKQAITAAGLGCMAALDAQWWLES